MSASRPRRLPSHPPGGSRRGGAAPTWLLVGLGLLAFAWAASGLQDSSRAAGFTTIDPSRVAIDAPGVDGVPTGWREHLAARLAALGELSSLDDDVVERVTAEIEALPFVTEVGPARVIWPDGVTVEVRLREAVACVRYGEDYLTVASDGMVLPGYWSAPCDLGLGLLPVIGPNDGSLDHLAPGEVLSEERHLDALSVAVSMREFLGPAQLRALGPVLIDASRAHLASVEEPGTRLELEDRRRVLFGRPPRARAPGELPQEKKWGHLMRAIGYLSMERPRDWDLVDVRWDVPALRHR